MVVLYQKGLENMAEHLKKKGMDMVLFGKATQADALLYSQENCGLINSLPVESGPLFLVNVCGRTKGEVLNMLNTRLYSPLAL